MGKPSTENQTRIIKYLSMTFSNPNTGVITILLSMMLGVTTWSMLAGTNAMGFIGCVMAWLLVCIGLNAVLKTYW